MHLGGRRLERRQPRKSRHSVYSDLAREGAICHVGARADFPKRGMLKPSKQEWFWSAT